MEKFFSSNRLSLWLSVATLLAGGAAFADHGEMIPADEGAHSEEILKIIIEKLGKTPLGQTVKRDAHPKHHGCLEATFTVLDHLPTQLREGLFEHHKTYSAYIRFSNGREQDDQKPDARGFALKIFGVQGEKNSPEVAFAETQDFLISDHEVFFIKDSEEYLEFTQNAIGLDNPLNYFLHGSFNPFQWHWKTAMILAQTVKRGTTNLLAKEYWSQTPYAFGKDRVMKYRVTPGDVGNLARVKTGSPDQLGKALAKSLRQSGASFDFHIQVATPSDATPVEDSRKKWKVAFHKVGRIEIPVQNFESDEQMALCEQSSFDPWHSLAAHRPLGGINRIRQVVYGGVSSYRHAANNVMTAEQTEEEIKKVVTQ